MEPDSEIGRELKVSELKPRTVVVVEKSGHPIMSTLWVYLITPGHVIFTSGILRGDFSAKRTGPDLEELTDDTGKPIRVYEYLGEI